MTPDPTENVTLTVAGATYSGWQSVRLTRAIDCMAAHFDIEVSERWANQHQAWQIAPFSPCAVRIGRDLVLTGYIDEYAPAYSKREHRVRVIGRSMTADLIDCTPDIPSGQFNGYTLEQIAHSICSLFRIDVVVQVSPSEPVADATIQRTETAFEFLERLGRLAGVLLTDDPQGRLVIGQVGAARATDHVQEGVNIQRATAQLNVCRRFSDYIVKGQHGIGGPGGANWGGAGGIGAASTSGPQVQTNQQATARDAGVPRYRPKVTIAEAPLDAQGMQLRANWQRAYHYGRATQATITVAGWRQTDGSLWSANQLVAVTCPWLQIDQDLLIVSTTVRIDAHEGRVTDLTVAPVEGYTPDPGQVKLRKHKGAKGGASGGWSGAGGLT